jgi:hypothetical protein
MHPIDDMCRRIDLMGAATDQNAHSGHGPVYATEWIVSIGAMVDGALGHDGMSGLEQKGLRAAEDQLLLAIDLPGHGPWPTNARIWGGIMDGHASGQLRATQPLDDGDRIDSHRHMGSLPCMRIGTIPYGMHCSRRDSRLAITGVRLGNSPRVSESGDTEGEVMSRTMWGYVEIRTLGQWECVFATDTFLVGGNDAIMDRLFGETPGVPALIAHRGRPEDASTLVREAYDQVADDEYVCEDLVNAGWVLFSDLRPYADLITTTHAGWHLLYRMMEPLADHFGAKQVRFVAWQRI